MLAIPAMTAILFSLVFVNGFTDAPNSLSCAISSHAAEFKKAKRLAAFFDGCGVLIFALLFPAVAKTSSEIAVFVADAKAALSAGMLSAVLWALFAWWFGIPTSESHAMSAAISGAAFFSGGSIGEGAWGKIFFGFFFSAIASALLSPVFFSLILKVTEKKKYLEEAPSIRKAQLHTCCACAFLHGAQDGQKFIGLLMLFSGTDKPNLTFTLSVAAIMALGTLCCTGRIIRKVAFEMVRPGCIGGLAADLSSLALMLTSTLFGLPVSTSNIKTCALIGIGKQVGGKSVNFRSFACMFALWLLTFPICFLLGGGLCVLFKAIF